MDERLQFVARRLAGEAMAGSPVIGHVGVSVGDTSMPYISRWPWISRVVIPRTDCESA